MGREAQAHGLNSIVLDPENYDYQHLSRLRSAELVIWVLATTGEGEPTDNFRSWYDALVSDPQDLENCNVPEFADLKDGDTGSNIEDDDDRPLNNVKYVGFGLGNTTYEQFCVLMRHTDSRMQALGAKRVGSVWRG